MYLVKTATKCTKLQHFQSLSYIGKPSDLRLVDDMIGLQLDGEFHSKLRREGAHG